MTHHNRLIEPHMTQMYQCTTRRLFCLTSIATILHLPSSQGLINQIALAWHDVVFVPSLGHLVRVSKLKYYSKTDPLNNNKTYVNCVESSPPMASDSNLRLTFTHGHHRLLVQQNMAVYVGVVPPLLVTHDCMLLVLQKNRNVPQ